MVPRLLAFAGSNRAGSFNQRLAAVAARELALIGAEVTLIALGDYPLPIIDREVERERAIPENATKLARLVAAHDGAVIASPEYNASIPPLLKNMIDWVSRVHRNGEPSPWQGRTVALASASERQSGGVLALDHLRAVMREVGARLVSEQCALGLAGDAFDADGGLRRPEDRAALQATCRALFELAFAMRSRA
jgi:chromate reductase, NAD(P)H dehydrogenase (quinone)